MFYPTFTHIIGGLRLYLQHRLPRGLFGPKWLSKEADSIGRIARELQRDSSDSQAELFSDVRDRFNQWLDGFGMAEMFVGIADVVLFYFCCAVWSIPFGLGSQNVYDSGWAVAGVMAGLLGTLLAIVVFSVQLHAERGGGKVFVPFIVRKHRVHFVIAIVGGVTLSNVIAAVVANFYSPFPFELVSYLNLPFVSISILVAINLLHNTMTDAPRLSFDPAMNILQRDLRYAQAANIQRHRMALRLLDVLRDLGLSVKWYSNRNSPTLEKFYTQKNGIVSDIDIGRLNDIKKIIECAEGNWAGSLGSTLGDQLCDDPCFYLSAIPKQNIDDITTGDPPEPTPEARGSGDSSNPARLDLGVRRDIQILLDGVYRIEPGHSKDRFDALDEFFNRYGELLRGLASGGAEVALRRSLKNYSLLVEGWATTAPAEPLGTRPIMPWAWNIRVIRGPMSIGMLDIIRSAVESKSLAVWLEVMEFLFKLARYSVHRNLPALLSEISGSIRFSYHNGIRQQCLAEDYSKAFDNQTHRLIKNLHLVVGRSSGEQEDSAECYNNLTTCTLTLRLMLDLIYSAIEQNQANDARQFVNHIFAHEEYGRNNRNVLEDLVPENEDLDTLHDYVAIVLAGWAAKWIKKHDAKTEAAAAVLGGVVSRSIDVFRLIGVWELYNPHVEPFGPEIDTRLGIEHWECKEELDKRPVGGTGAAMEGDNNWVERGLHALFLGGSSLFIDAYEHYFGGRKEAPDELWNTGRSKGWLEDYASIEAITDTDEKKRSRRIEGILKVIGKRQRGSKGAWAQGVVSSEIDPEIPLEIKSQVSRSFAKHRPLIDILGELGVEESSDDSTNFANPIERRVRAGRERFVAKEDNWMGWIEPSLSMPLAEQESIVLFLAAEEQYRKLAGGDLVKLEHLCDLPAHIDAAVSELKKRGIEPDLIILPRDRRFALALHQTTDYWSIQGINDAPESGRGRWNALRVICWPYAASESILVTEANRLFGKRQVGAERLGISIEDAGQTEKEDWLQNFEQEPTGSSQPEIEPLRVLVTATLRQEIGLQNDPDACYILDVVNSDGAFAMLEGGHDYHRVGCQVIQNARASGNTVITRLVRWLPNEKEFREACSECQPERMNYDADQWINSSNPDPDQSQ